VRTVYLLPVLFALAMPLADAGCPIGVPPPSYYVGTDGHCKYSTIQAAILDVPSPTTCTPNIYVTNEHTTWNEVLTIDKRSLNLIGLAGACGTSSTMVESGGAYGNTPRNVTSPQVTISGAGKNAPVITISDSSNVSIQGIEITGGGIDQNSEGGGIFFNGSGSLTLSASTVDNNTAGYGGGIDMSPSGSATLTLGANTQVINNTAGHSGGGIRIEGETRLFMLSEASTVSFNTAQFDYGGGIEILGPARADIGSPGAAVVGAVSFNSAPYGGGIAILGGSAGDATARLFSTSATQPVSVSDNSASAEGGAIYLDVPESIAYANFCAFAFRINDNSAPDGAAIYADADEDSSDSLYDTTVYLNTGGDCGPESPASLGAVACAPGTPCNEVSGNSTLNASDTPTGAIITLNPYNNLGIERLDMRQNNGTQMISATAASSSNYLHSCLIADNASLHELIHYYDENVGTSPLTVTNCTLVNNTISDGYAFYVAGGFTLTDTIIDEPGTSTLDHVNGTCDPSCELVVASVLSNDISTLPPFVSIFAGDPLFVDPANANVADRDYHLLAYLQNGAITASPAIDYAPTVSGDPNTDLDGIAYAQDVPGIANVYGPRDLGAYEAQPITDRIFGDTFGDRLSLVY